MTYREPWSSEHGWINFVFPSVILMSLTNLINDHRATEQAYIHRGYALIIGNAIGISDTSLSEVFKGVPCTRFPQETTDEVFSLAL